jgi:hypothetical protein
MGWGEEQGVKRGSIVGKPTSYEFEVEVTRTVTSTIFVKIDELDNTVLEAAVQEIIKKGDGTIHAIDTQTPAWYQDGDITITAWGACG